MKFKSTNEIETIQLRDAQIKEMKLVGAGEVEAEGSGEEETDGTAETVSEVKADVAEAVGQAKKMKQLPLKDFGRDGWNSM